MSSRMEVMSRHIRGSCGRGSNPIGVIQIGLGPIGIRMVKDICTRKGVQITGAIDIDPQKVGRDIADVCGLPSATGITVSRPSELRNIPGDVCIVTTVSSLDRLYPVIEQCITCGKHVVSSCEELSFPFASHPGLSAKIDALAKKHNVAVLGTGINPGFLMDMLPVLMSGLCRDVKSVRVERHQDSRIRRLPFQQKIGAGLDMDQWVILRDKGKIRHVGFSQSIHMIARALGWKLDGTDETIEPVVATHDVSSPLLKVPAGKCCGVKQTAHGYMNGKAVITLELCANNGLEHPHDTVILEGTPNVRSSIGGGVHGDISTSAIIINCVQSIVNAEPGLRTMVEIPVIHWLK